MSLTSLGLFCVLVMTSRAHSCTSHVRWSSKAFLCQTAHASFCRWQAHYEHTCLSQICNNRFFLNFFFQPLEHSGEKLRKDDWHDVFTSACMLASCGLFARPTNTERHYKWIQGCLYDLPMNPSPIITLLIALFLVFTGTWRSRSATWCRGSGVHWCSWKELQAKKNTTTTVERVKPERGYKVK